MVLGLPTINRTATDGPSIRHKSNSVFAIHKMLWFNLYRHIAHLVARVAEHVDPVDELVAVVAREDHRSVDRDVAVLGSETSENIICYWKFETNHVLKP